MSFSRTLGDVVDTAAGLVEIVIDLLVPATCAGCRSAAVERGLCSACRARFRAASPVSSAVHVGAGRTVVPAFAATAYDSVARTMLLAYKERGRQSLRHELAGALFVACLAAYAAGCFATDVGLVPVPSRRATTKARGHDAVLALARAACAELRRVGVRACVVPALRHARAVADQAGLTMADRQANLAGALEVRRPAEVAGRVLLVVDDIVTTGATSGEAARALSAAGGLVTAVVAVAATPRRRTPRSRPDRWDHDPAGHRPAATEPPGTNAPGHRTDAAGHPRPGHRRAGQLPKPNAARVGNFQLRDDQEFPGWAAGNVNGAEQ